ncbi:MAG: DUF1287 domain-containing protein [Hyphomicrobiaceae bacterium]|nr:DUF1287 domain-containing protein [Hyphomicrobiaceae bacterium]
MGAGARLAMPGYAHSAHDRDAFDRFRQQLDCASRDRSQHVPAPLLASAEATPVRPDVGRGDNGLLAVGFCFVAALVVALSWRLDVARSLQLAAMPRDEIAAVGPARTLSAKSVARLIRERTPGAAIVAHDEDAMGRPTQAVEDGPGTLAAPEPRFHMAATRGPSGEAAASSGDVADASASTEPSKLFQTPWPAQLAALGPLTPLVSRSPALESDPGRCSVENSPTPQPATSPKLESDEFGRALAAAALRQTSDFVVYTDKYRKLAYPMGDVPALFGVCTDVVIRAYRTLGIDLQALIHASRIGSADTSIAHRRTFTLRRYFASRGASVPITDFAEDYLPGDIVTYDRPQNSGSRDHIAIVSDVIAPSGRPMIVHNRGWGPQLEDALFVDRITGHYRYRGRIDPILSGLLNKRRRIKDVALSEGAAIAPSSQKNDDDNAGLGQVKPTLGKRVSGAKAKSAKTSQ